MARQVRKDLSYFTLDCDIFSAKSGLKSLIDRFQADGLAVYIHILCDVYGTGYYFKPDNYEDYLYSMVKDIGGITVEKVQLIIAFMADRTLLDAFSLNKNTVFTSHGIQKRYAQAMKGRKRSVAEIRGEYWLLTEKEEREIDTFYKSHPFADKSEKISDKSEKNEDKSEIYDITEQNQTEQKETIDSQTGGELDFYMSSLKDHLTDSQLYEEDKARILEIAAEVTRRKSMKINGVDTPAAKVIQSFIYLCNKPRNVVSDLLYAGEKDGVKNKLLYTVAAMYNGALGF